MAKLHVGRRSNKLVKRSYLIRTGKRFGLSFYILQNNNDSKKKEKKKKSKIVREHTRQKQNQMIRDPCGCRWESVVNTSKYQLNRKHVRAAGATLTHFVLFRRRAGGRSRWFNSASLSAASLLMLLLKPEGRPGGPR